MVGRYLAFLRAVVAANALVVGRRCRNDHRREAVSEAAYVVASGRKDSRDWSLALQTFATECFQRSLHRMIAARVTFERRASPTRRTNEPGSKRTNPAATRPRRPT